MNRFAVFAGFSLCALLVPQAVHVAVAKSNQLVSNVTPISTSFPWSEFRSRKHVGRCDYACSHQCYTALQQCEGSCGELPASGTDPRLFSQVSHCQRQCHRTATDCRDACDNADNSAGDDNNQPPPNCQPPRVCPH